jgi:hypothetical protein
VSLPLPRWIARATSSLPLPLAFDRPNAAAARSMVCAAADGGQAEQVAGKGAGVPAAPSRRPAPGAAAAALIVRSPQPATVVGRSDCPVGTECADRLPPCNGAAA